VLGQGGDTVRKGQMLVTLDPRDFQLSVVQKRAEVGDLQAQLEELLLLHQNHRQSLQQEQQLLQLAEAEVQRMQRLQTQQLGSDSSLSDARAALGRQELSVLNRQVEVQRFESKQSQLQARLQRAEAALQQAELDQQRSRVTASFDGVIRSLDVSVGDRVQAGKLLLSLYALDSLEIRARLPARFQQEIQTALQQQQTLMARSDQGLEMQLVRLAGEADPGGIDVYFRPQSGAQSLRPGNLLKLELARPALQDVVAIPYPALYGNDRIYVLRKGRMHGLSVETLGRSLNAEGENLLLIRSAALRPDDAIIVTHLPNAINGLKVRDSSQPAAQQKQPGKLEAKS